METTIGARIRLLREAKQLSVADFAKAAGVKPSAVYGLESGANKPSLETVAALRTSFPGLNTEWLQFGEGEMFGRNLSPALRPEPAQPLTVAQEPAAAYGPTAYTPAAYSLDPSFAQQLINELADCQKQNRADLKQAQQDFREDLTANAKHWQYTVDRMEDTINEQKATIADLRAEVFRLLLAAGLRQPTAEEREAMRKQIEEREKEKPVPNPIGWQPSRREEEVQQPQAEEVEMYATPGGLHDYPFTRPQPLEEERHHLQAA